MNKIKQIKLKHFKFFYGEVNIDFDRDNALIFGENGSGKSSLYWALYTFLQSVFKDTPNKVQKYFQYNHDENLRNRFAPDTEDSYIKIVFEDDHESITEKTISNSTVNTRTGNLVRQAVQGSELINYKLLSKMHDFKNPYQIDLFPIMDKDILVFINFREILVRHDGITSTANAQDWWEYIKPGMHPRGKMHEQPYKTFAAAVEKFSSELQFYLDSIIESVNDYLIKFKQPFTVSLELQPCTYDAFETGSTTKRNHKTVAPKVFVNAHFNHDKVPADKQKITRPHTFLNEAKLTAIALSIRFAMLDQKIGGTAASDTPKVLVLDDVLISLDMSNREIVLNIILKEFLDNQLIILTHDRNFFELLRHKIKQSGQENWKYIEMYDCEKDGIPQPFIKKSDTYLEKAELYYHKKEYEIAGNFLRKEAESFCKEFLPKKYHYTSEFNLHDLNGLIVQCKIFAENAGLDKTLFEDLDSQRKFVLNPTSHDSYDVPKFNSEVGNCLQTLKDLREIKNEPFLKRGEQVEFELSDGTDTYKFEIKLEDDFRLLKEPGKDSVISRGMVNYWVTKNAVKGDLQHKQDSIKKMYESCYADSDLTKNPDFWEEITVTRTENKLVNHRPF
ncbi:MAG: AAA family ATPase [Ignavibacteriae bacterium]|nr:AAA family ATPase [Ignavibacteriota bacterium]